jgi:cytochrome c oxidase subunit 2
MNKTILIWVVWIIWISVWAWFLWNKPTTDSNAISVSDQSETRVIQVDARKFSFTPNDIRVTQWENVRLKINNIDMEHWAYFMDWETNTDDQWNIIVDTSQAWTQIFSCANMCGSWHNDMQWRIIVESNTEPVVMWKKQW